MRLNHKCKTKNQKTLAIALFIVFPEDKKDMIKNLLSLTETLLLPI